MPIVGVMTLILGLCWTVFRETVPVPNTPWGQAVWWSAWWAVLLIVVFAALTRIIVFVRLLRGRNNLPARKSRNEEGHSPPLLAEALLCIFARDKDINSLRGDFEEIFARNCASGMKLRRAKALYWAWVIRSIGPQMVQAVRRLGWFGLIMAALRR